MTARAHRKLSTGRVDGTIRCERSARLGLARRSTVCYGSNWSVGPRRQSAVLSISHFLLKQLSARRVPTTVRPLNRVGRAAGHVRAATKTGVRNYRGFIGTVRYNFTNNIAAREPDSECTAAK